MNEITVWLPWVGNLRLDEPPENLEFYVMKSFHNLRKERRRCTNSRTSCAI